MGKKCSLKGCMMCMAKIMNENDKYKRSERGECLNVFYQALPLPSGLLIFLKTLL